MASASFDAKNFSENFYSDIKNEVYENEQKQLIESIQAALKTREEFVENLLNDNLSIDEQKELDNLCANNAKSGISAKQICLENIEEFIAAEIDLAKIQSQMNAELSVNEIWSNGTLVDSPFDLVVDLNIIDVILFGSEAEIPFAQYDKKKRPVSSVVVGRRISTEGTTNSGDDLDDSKDDFIELTEGGVLYSGDDLDMLSSDDDITSDYEGELNTISSIDNQLACSDPRELVYIDFSVNDNSSSDSSSNDENGNIDINANNSSDALNTEDSSSSLPNDNLSDSYLPGSFNSSDPDLQNLDICKNSLYGGYYCKRPGTYAQKCDNKIGFCDNCMQISEHISFCIKSEIRKSNHSLFSSSWVEDSIQSYTENSLAKMEGLLGVTNLSPVKRQNQGGFITHVWDFLRGIDDMLEVHPKTVPLNSREAKQLNDTRAELEESAKELSKNDRLLDDDFLTKQRISTQALILEEEKKQALKLVMLDAEIDSYKRSSRVESQKLYYQNLEQNLRNLVSVFEERILKNTATFPFADIKRLQTNVCK